MDSNKSSASRAEPTTRGTTRARKARMVALFDLGGVVATPGALEVLGDTGTDALALLSRHVRGDWGEVPPEDARENELSVREGFRIISSYPLGDGEAGAKLWIITEADRSSTCILLPEEY